MRNLLILVLLFSFQSGRCQNRFKAGVELDALPYITGGYFAAGWAGAGHARVRALYAKVHMPAFVVPNGFTNNTINSFALLGDYFLKKNFKGPWMSAGIVMWQGDIQTDKRIETATYNIFLLNGSLGFVHYFNRWLYISPWAGMSIRGGGDSNIPIDGENFNPPVFNPELSVKVGIRF